MYEKSDRPHGVTVWPMPKQATGPFAKYALLVRDDEEGLQLRMVHTEGVAYLVTADKPWRWNDYDPDAQVFTVEDLMDLIDHSNDGVDLADWIRTFGSRLESNFHQVYAWANED